MAENVTPVTLNVKDFAAREVLLVDYKFNQATDREGQISGIPRGGRVNIRVKAMNDGNCVKYKEYWADGEEHYEDIEIVCQKLENGPVAFENPWR